jgi:uncharacterized damage-inducible protein DinB
MYKDSAYLKKYFLAHREVTKELVEKIDREHYGYQPTSTSMTAEQLVVHMLTAFHQFVSTAAGKNPENLHEDTENVSLNELAERYTQADVRLIESFDETALDETVDLTEMIGKKVPAWKVIEMAVDHEINHKGNLFVYVREMGYNQLPMFVK